MATLAQIDSRPKSMVHPRPWTGSEMSIILLIAGIIVGFVIVVFVRSWRGRR